MWPCPKHRGVTIGCPYLEIGGQSCLVGNVDQGLMKNRQIDLLGRMTQKRVGKKTLESYFPDRDVTRNISANNPPRKMQTFNPNYRLSIAIGFTKKTYITN